MEKQNPAPFEAIKARSSELLEELIEISESLTSQTFKDRCMQIQTNRDAGLEQLAKSLTAAKQLTFV